MIWFASLLLIVAAGTPASLAASLEPGHVVEATLAPHTTASYRVTVAAGDFVLVRLLRREADMGLRLLDAAGAVLIDTEAQPRLLWIAAGGSSLRLEVYGPERQATPLAYAVVLEERRPANDLDNLRIAAQDAMLKATGVARSDPAMGAAGYDEARSLWHQA